MKNRIIFIITCLFLLFAVLFGGVAACKKSSDVNEVADGVNSDAIGPQNAASQKVKLPWQVNLYLILSIVFSAIIFVFFFWSHKTIHEKLRENKSDIRKLTDTSRRQSDTIRNDGGEKVGCSDNQEVKELLLELAGMIRNLSSNIAHIRVDVPDIKLPDFEGTLKELKEDILLTIMEWDTNGNTDMHSDQAINELKSIKNISEELQKGLTEIFDILKPKQDKSTTLRIHFEDKYELVRDRFYEMIKENYNVNAAVESFIKDFSLIINIHAISSDRDQLEKAYLALSDTLSGYNLELISPMPGDEFNERIMDQSKIYGDDNKVHKVVYPGFILDNYLCKAKVDVI